MNSTQHAGISRNINYNGIEEGSYWGWFVDPAKMDLHVRSYDIKPRDRNARNYAPAIPIPKKTVSSVNLLKQESEPLIFDIEISEKTDSNITCTSTRNKESSINIAMHSVCLLGLIIIYCTMYL